MFIETMAGVGVWLLFMIFVSLVQIQNHLSSIRRDRTQDALVSHNLQKETIVELQKARLRVR